MGSPRIVRLPWVDDPAEADAREVDVAIAMVGGKIAHRVRLVGLRDPEGVAPVALARAQAAGLQLGIERSDDSVTLVISRRLEASPADR
jgi:hypothetical protein